MTTEAQRAAQMAGAIERAELDEESEEARPYARPRRPEAAAQVYSVRVPVARLEELRACAAERGLRPASLVRRWIVERLDQERSVRHDRTPKVALIDRIDDLQVRLGDALRDNESSMRSG